MAAVFLLCLQKESTVHLDGSLDLTAFPSKTTRSPGSASSRFLSLRLRLKEVSKLPTKRYYLKDIIDKDVIR